MALSECWTSVLTNTACNMGRASGVWHFILPKGGSFSSIKTVARHTFETATVSGLPSCSSS